MHNTLAQLEMIFKGEKIQFNKYTIYFFHNCYVLNDRIPLKIFFIKI